MRETFLLNEGWKFRKEAEITKTAGDDYFDMFKSNTKTGIVSGPKSASFYDGDWETVTLPHDWVIREAPNEKYSSNGFYEGDVHLPCDELLGITNLTVGIMFHLNGEDCGIKGLIYAEC